MIEVKIINESKWPMPEYKHEGDSGCDLRADIEFPFVLQPGRGHLFPTGIHVQMPEGVEAQVRGRSGLNCVHDIICPVGTVDQPFTGNIGVKLYNLGSEPFTINPGDRIAQLVFAKVEKAEFKIVESLDETARGDNGFGSTGLK